MKVIHQMLFWASCVLLTTCQPVKLLHDDLSAQFFGIPQYDLDAESSLQQLVDQEKGQYLGHPTTVLLDDQKTVLVVYPRGHGKGAILYKKSENGGKTWSERLPTPENWDTSLETPTIYQIRTQAGGRRLLLFSGLYPIRLATSDDNGHHWTPLKPIGNFGGIVAMASLEVLKEGSLMALFHDDGRFIREKGAGERRFRVYKTLSSDDGKTWSEPIEILTDATLHLCEPGAIRSPDGRQIALLMRENSRKAPSQIVFSTDEGENWSQPRALPLALTGDRHTAKYLKDGRLFIAFRDMAEGSPTKGDWVAWVGTYQDLVEGKKGELRFRIKDNKNQWDAAYPGVEVFPDGRVLTVTYGHWSQGEEPYILAVHLPANLLFARKKSR
ncbi:MAG: exo-alpha-sialidase [Bacteroidetes Order II. Incertae sedis bacterium]|nr:exo-alpha-sialidase [Bacteroidetes Order II. bacterium]